MRAIRIIFLFVFTNIFAHSTLAQIDNQCSSWEVKASKQEVKVGEEVEISFFVTPKPDFYTYSSDFAEGGPQVTQFNFEKNSSYQLVGGLRAIDAKKKFDDIFEMEVKYFNKKGEFRQKIKILKENFQIKGTVEYQTCSDKTGVCVPCEYDFVFNDIKIISAGKLTIEEENKQTSNKDENSSITAKSTDSVASNTQNQATPTDGKTFGIPVSTSKDSSSVKVTANRSENTPAKTDNNVAQQEENLFLFALGAFLAGLVALLTPCVYPMIPMTVSIFMKGDKKAKPDETSEETQARNKLNRRNSIIKASVYGLSIVGMFTLLGLAASLAFGIEFSNALSTDWLPNLIFFTLFVVFALSFLGMFEIVLPNSFVNKMDAKADQGGYLGVFFMAFTLVLVSFSCTAPIAGSIILLSTQGGHGAKPLIGMIAYSLAFALPFTFFALFPSTLKSLPKSGGWLNSVKVVLGFLELALALKFLSTADLAYHWGILNRDVFLSLWIAIFSLLGVYLIGKIQLPLDSKLEKVPVPRMILAILTFSFVIYMIPGLFGANLKMLAGIIPPKTTQEFDLTKSGGHGAITQLDKSFPEKVKYDEFLHIPNGLNGFFDYKEGLAYAQKVNKPVFLDFTGHGCANCRRMEENVWIDPSVIRHLNNDYVIISLYTDDKTELAESEWVISKIDGKIKKSIGKINLHFEAERFNNIAQPYYVLLDTKGEMLVKPPMGYEPDANIFNKYLETGLAEFKKRNKVLTQ